MKRTRSVVLLWFFCLGVLSPISAGAQTFISTQGRQLVTPDGQPLLLRGTNLGNWLVPEGYMFKWKTATSPRMIHEVLSELVGPEQARRFWQRFQDAYMTRADIHYLKSQGFNCLRIPFHYALFTGQTYLGMTRNRGFELLDRVIGWCQEEGIYVILDMHCAPGGQTGDNIDDSWGYPWLFESPEAQRAAIDTWVRIAAHYRENPAVIGYDLLNEPIATYFDADRLNPRLEPLYIRMVAAIRTVDPNHLIFLGGAQWDSNFQVFHQPFDAKLVYTFHKYWTDTTQTVIQDYLEFRDRYDVPLFMGESGENTDAWIRGFRHTLERNRVSWTFWPYKKMASGSCVVQFAQPENYDLIIQFANGARTSFEEIRQSRPDVGKVQAALEAFLNNARFDNCTPNQGYIDALLQ